MVVIDELATLRNHKGKTWAAVNQLVQPAQFATGLTGSPTPNGPWDAYGQVRLMTPDRVRLSYSRFRDQVAIQVSDTLWTPRANHREVVHLAMQPAVRFKRSDVIELKAIHHHTLTCDLSKLQLATIEELRVNLLAQFAEGAVVASNAAVLVGKLLQAAGGAVYTDTQSFIDLKAHDRLLMLDSLIESAEGKVIVFAAYRHIGQIVAKTLRAAPFNRKAQVLHMQREMGERERYNILSMFKDPRHESRVLISHPRLMSHGLNLTVADTIVWYTPTTSTETYQQANGRITRAGQEREQMIYHLRATRVEDKVYTTLARNQNMQAAVLALFEHGL
jgi:hypothetical protein